MSFPVEAAAAQIGLDADYPKLKDFLQRIHARPAYARALERGGKYELLTWNSLHYKTLSATEERV